MIFDIFSTRYLLGSLPDNYIAKLRRFNLKSNQTNKLITSYTIELNTIDDLSKIMELFPELLIEKGDNDELPTIQIADTWIS